MRYKEDKVGTNVIKIILFIFVKASEFSLKTNYFSWLSVEHTKIPTWNLFFFFFSFQNGQNDGRLNSPLELKVFCYEEAFCITIKIRFEQLPVIL